VTNAGFTGLTWKQSKVLPVEDGIITLMMKAQQVKSNVKTMLIAFFDIDRLVHHQYIPRGQTVN
jgi:hypothetical protein